MLVNYDLIPFLGSFHLINLYSALITFFIFAIIRRLSKKEFTKQKRYTYNYFGLILVILHYIVYLSLLKDLNEYSNYTYVYSSMLFVPLIFMLLDDPKKIEFYSINRPKRKNYTKIIDLLNNTDYIKSKIFGKYTKTTNSVSFKNTPNEEIHRTMEIITLNNEIIVPISSKINKTHILINIVSIAIFEFLNISIIVYLYLK